MLIIFIKNPELGKAKTRLAATLGNQRALEIYHQLLAYTREVTLSVDVERQLHYSSFISEDTWSEKDFKKRLQSGTNLGERMSNAFSKVLGNGAKKVVLIGSDCAELTKEILEAAFTALDEAPVVFGPASDGGYYLVGMTKLYSEIFADKPWSQSNLLAETLNSLAANSINYRLLPELSDVDTEADWNLVKDKF